MEFVTRAESEMHEAQMKMTNLSWNYKTNITDETEAKKLEYQVNHKLQGIQILKVCDNFKINEKSLNPERY